MLLCQGLMCLAFYATFTLKTSCSRLGTKKGVKTDGWLIVRWWQWPLIKTRTHCNQINFNYPCKPAVLHINTACHTIQDETTGLMFQGYCLIVFSTTTINLQTKHCETLLVPQLRMKHWGCDVNIFQASKQVDIVNSHSDKLSSSIASHLKNWAKTHHRESAPCVLGQGSRQVFLCQVGKHFKSVRNWRP